MQTTHRGHVPPYIGADLTDRHAGRAQPVDVCGLAPGGLARLKASYWEWTGAGARGEAAPTT